MNDEPNVMVTPTTAVGRSAPPRRTASADDVPAGVGAASVSAAPLRLEVMGGLAECSGGLVLTYPLDYGVRVTVRAREDQSVFVQVRRPSGGDVVKSLSLPLTALRDGAAAPPTVEEAVARIPATAEPAAALAIAAWVGGIRAGVLPDADRGISFSIVENLPPGETDLGSAPATAAAAFSACAKLSGAEPDAQRAAQVCADAEYAVLRRPCGQVDALAALVGRAQSLLPARGRPLLADSPLPLPEDAALVGIICGLTSQDWVTSLCHTRAAAQMGRVLIERIASHEKLSHLRLDGLLSRLTMSDYVERFRDRLPTRLSGEDFIARFGDEIDPRVRIDPRTTYKVRSRTEHHIYENARSVQFAERLSRYTRTGDVNTLVEAGELMYASHWSHSQRCGLGSVQTDRLVAQLRRRGAASGILGAKSSGRGCGGLVVVLIRRTPSALEALTEVCAEYERCGERPCLLLTGSSDGAAATRGAEP